MIKKNDYKEIAQGMLVVLAMIVETDDKDERAGMCGFLVNGIEAMENEIDNEWHDDFVTYGSLMSYALGIIAMSDDATVRLEGAAAISSALGEIGHKMYFD